MIIRMTTRTVYYPVSKRQATDLIRGSGRVRYVRGSLLLSSKILK